LICKKLKNLIFGPKTGIVTIATRQGKRNIANIKRDIRQTKEAAVRSLALPTTT
jgi:hypothetical protein